MYGHHLELARIFLAALQLAWDVVKSVVVPIAVATLAAWIATRGLRATLNSQAHSQKIEADSRLADRRERAIHAGVDALLRGAMSPLAVTPAMAQRERFLPNASLASMYSLLQPEELPIGRWIARTNILVIGHAEKVPLESIGKAWPNAVDVEAAEASKIAAWAVERLIEWLREERPIQWFVDDLARLEAGGAPDVP